MINICNIFRPTDKLTGNFILFSQYTRDLARFTVDSTYKVRPSRFYCVDINNARINAMNTPDTSSTNTFPTYFQNVFENGIAEVRNEDITLENHNFSVAFWQSLLNATTDAGFADWTTDIKYVGNIDIESFENGFADILLNIPSGSYKTKLVFNDVWGTSAHTRTEFNNACNIEPYTSSGFISGWSASDNLPLSGVVTSGSHTGIGIGSIDGVSANVDTGDENSVFDNIFVKQNYNEGETVPNSFTFNTIILTYNIIDQDNNVLSNDIPLGIYITGKCSGSDTEISDPVTIYKSADTAYGAGSSWSLRVSTRFSSAPNGYLKVEDVAIESGALYDSISALMSANAEAIKTLQSFADNNIYGKQTLQSYLAQFKNQQVNVPYIRTVNGVNYWFVNGKNTEVVAGTGGIEYYNEGEIQEIFE